MIFALSSSLARAGVWLLFNGLLALFFSFFYVIPEFDRFLTKRISHKLCREFTYRLCLKKDPHFEFSSNFF